MNGIIGMADLLNETNLDSQQKEYLHTIQKSGQILLNLVNNVLGKKKRRKYKTLFF